MVKKGKKAMVGLLGWVTIMVGLLVGAYFMMIAIRPHEEKPVLDSSARNTISDLEASLRKHVITLAQEIGERNLTIPANLKKAAEYVRDSWQGMGYEVTSQTYPVRGIDCVNLSVEIIGTKVPDEIVIVGAHYDSVIGSPGANDNGSAVAAVLEISRMFHNQVPKRTVRFVAFTNEEPPFFTENWMGSRVYARTCRERGENIVGMLSIETIGYFTDLPETQHYPPPLGLFYPSQGNFLAVVGNLRSRHLVISFTRAFMQGIDFPVECVAAVSFIPGISWSDHSSFWKYGYPAIMITDTAPYRYPYYHTSEDMPDKINYVSLSKVTYGTYCAVCKLAAQD